MIGSGVLIILFVTNLHCASKKASICLTMLGCLHFWPIGIHMFKCSTAVHLHPGLWPFTETHAARSGHMCQPLRILPVSTMSSYWCYGAGFRIQEVLDISFWLAVAMDTSTLWTDCPIHTKRSRSFWIGTGNHSQIPNKYLQTQKGKS